MPSRKALRFAAVPVRPTLLLALALIVFWLFAYHRVSQLGWEFFQMSPSGPRALLTYLARDYAGAARAYRGGLRSAVIPGYADDPSGYWALRSGDLPQAELRARTTLMLVPTAVEPLVTLGEIALERGNAQQALAQLSLALARHPDHMDALYLTAVALTRAGNPDRAIDMLNRALRSGVLGKRDTILYRIMELAGDLGDKPANQRPLCLLAHLHRYLRIFDDGQAPIALAYARQAIATSDHPADAYLTLGVVLDKQGQYDAALRAVRRAVEVNPHHAEALRWLAVAARRLGDLLLEYQMIKQAFEAAPTDPYYLDHLEDVVLKKLGDPYGMAALMRRAIEADDANAAAHERLARAAAIVGDQAQARRHAQKAAELRGIVRAGSQ